jgi:hypothetical protein
VQNDTQNFIFKSNYVIICYKMFRSQIYELSLVEIKRFTVKHVLRGHLWDREKVVLKTFSWISVYTATYPFWCQTWGTNIKESSTWFIGYSLASTLLTMVNGQAFSIIIWQLQIETATWGHAGHLCGFGHGNCHQYPPWSVGDDNVI